MHMVKKYTGKEVCSEESFPHNCPLVLQFSFLEEITIASVLDNILVLLYIMLCTFLILKQSQTSRKVTNTV